MAPDTGNTPLDVGPAATRTRNRPRPPSRRPGDRYSQIVRWMKYVLPAIAIILLGTVLIVPLVEDSGGPGESAETDAGEPIRNFEMANPRYVGTDDEGRPFQLTARRARQTELGANEVSLEDPRARVSLDSGNFLYVTAQNGEYRQQERVLVLTGDVNFFHDGGYTFKTERAEIDMSNNTAHGNRPVIATGPKGTLEAEGFRVTDRGQTVVFTGRSRVRLNLTERDIGTIAGPGQAGGASQ